MSSINLDPVDGAGTTHRITSLLGNAVAAEAPLAITSSAQSKLNATPTANDRPKALRSQPAPNRRLLDMELRP
jgi:hypothetical protein